MRKETAAGQEQREGVRQDHPGVGTWGCSCLAQGQGREAGVAFVYLDQGQLAYSQEVRLPGQPVMGVAGARDSHSADPRRLPHLHLRPWWGLGEARDRSEEERGGVLQSRGGPAW